MKEHPDNGLWVPDDTNTNRPGWPPRIKIPEDTLHPRDEIKQSSDRPMNTNSNWNDENRKWAKPPQA